MNDNLKTIRKIGSRKNIFFSLILLCMSLIFCEIGWRTYLYTIGKGFFDDGTEFTSPFFTMYDEPRPFHWPGGPFYYRNGQVSLKKSDNEIRIICFGGSTTVNWRAGISYAQVLEEQFAQDAKGYTVRVLNAGGDGYSTAHTLVNFSLRNLEAQPDIITIYHNINDLSVNWFGNGIVSDYGNKYKTDFYLGLRHRIGVIANIGKVSRLTRSAVSGIRMMIFPKQQMDQNRDYELGLQYFMRNLRSIIAVAKSHRVRVVLASQAAKSDYRNNPGFLAYNLAIKKIAEEENVMFIDLANTVTDDTFFMSDSIHYTKEGVEAVAKQFYKPLFELVRDVKKDRDG